jgi:hypothetical protein
MLAMAVPQLPVTVRLAGMLTLNLLISQAGQITVTFVDELDAASADQADGYMRDAMSGVHAVAICSALGKVAPTAD